MDAELQELRRRVAESPLDDAARETLARTLDRIDPLGAALVRTRARPVVGTLQDLIDDGPVLLSGGSFASRHSIASALHVKSERRARPFLVFRGEEYVSDVDEIRGDPALRMRLFGYEYSSFVQQPDGTFHVRKAGELDSAGGGTVFFDRVELVVPARATLSSVIRRREYSRFTTILASEPREAKLRWILGSHLLEQDRPSLGTLGDLVEVELELSRQRAFA